MIPPLQPSLGEEELNSLRGVLHSHWLGRGNACDRFEQTLAGYLSMKHVLAVHTGTAALHLALAALDLRPDDEVLVPSLTFTSVVQAVVLAGARPVFCEVDPETLNIDVADARRQVTPRTRVFLAVHGGGQACDLAAVRALAHEYNLRVVEDAAQAFGSSYAGRLIGSTGDITCFSFDPVKNITCGDGGAIATNDDELAQRILPLRNVGIDRDSWKYVVSRKTWAYSVVTAGYRYNMSDLNAAIGLVQFDKRDAFRRRKLEIVRRYETEFRDVPAIRLPQRNWDETFPFSFVIRVCNGRRNELMNHLREREIGTLVHYPPNHLQPAFKAWHRPLPVTEQLYDEVLTLPLYVEMTDADVARVIAEVGAFLG
jgi:perosamine synthetase